MKKIFIIIIVLALTFPLISDKKMDEKEMMKRWMEIATPGSMHKILAEKVGKFTTKGKMWMKPGETPVESKGTAEGRMIIGGRYLKMNYKGDVNGMPFEGESIYAYDNYKKKFISTWLDNMGTGILVSSGTLDKTGKILTEVGEMDDFMTNSMVKYKIVNIKVDSDTFKMLMYSLYPGKKELKTMEMVYTRVK